MVSVKLPARGTIVALYSSTMQSGKSEVARVLAEHHGFEVVKFASPLKDMLRSLLTDMGHAPEVIEEMLEGRLKETPIPSLGVTPRRMMQTLGTDWGRALINRDLWVRACIAKVQHLVACGKNVVVDDMRLPNEYDALEELGAMLVWVRRKGVAKPGDVSCEGALDDNVFHTILHNDDPLEALHQKANDLARTVLLTP